MGSTMLQLDEETLASARRLAAARHVTVEELVKEALVQLERQPQIEDTVLGMFTDAPELLDEIVEDAMRARERDPLRSGTEA